MPFLSKIVDLRSPLNRAEYWRDRADEVRAIADQMRKGPSRDQLLNIAEMDDALAVRMESQKR